MFVHAKNVISVYTDVIRYQCIQISQIKQIALISVFVSYISSVQWEATFSMSVCVYVKKGVQGIKQTMTATKQPQPTAQPPMTSSDVTPKPSHVTGEEERQKDST